MLDSRLDWAIGALVGIAIVAGLGWLLMSPQGMAGYISDNPEACNGCHTMNANYEGWFHAGHRRDATCNDCHVPHDTALKWAAKFYKGSQHVFFYTTNQIPAQIVADDVTRQMVQGNCVRCHEATVALQPGLMDGSRPCFTCHRTVAHGERRISAFGQIR